MKPMHGPTHWSRRWCRNGFITTSSVSSVSFSFPQLQKSSIDWKKRDRKVDLLSPEQSYEDGGFRQPEKGLSLLVQHVLGKPLDKTEQLSNWEKRPLREEQILYAGLVAGPSTWGKVLHIVPYSLCLSVLCHQESH